MNYRRSRHAGGTYFFTVNIAERKQDLLVAHIESLRASFRLVKQRHPFHIDAIVVLPDHLHAVWTLPKGDAEHVGWDEERIPTFNKNPEIAEYHMEVI